MDKTDGKMWKIKKTFTKEQLKSKLVINCMFMCVILYSLSVVYLSTWDSESIATDVRDNKRQYQPEDSRISYRHKMNYNVLKLGHGHRYPGHVNICFTEHIHPDLVDGPYQNLLTLFTTLKTTPDKFRIYNNTIHNWASLRPEVQPVLFTNTPDGQLETIAQKLGWKTSAVRRQNYKGTPVLKDMFMHFQKAGRYGNSAFYGFSNGDILFDYSLINNLKMVDALFRKTRKCLMVVGQRKNYDIAKDEELYLPEDVNEAALSVTKWFGSGAEDFFIVPRNLFPWKRIPDVVIGRPGYDNFLVIYARTVGVGIIDATLTLPALHQTGTDGNKAGEKSEDADYNIQLISKSFPHLVLQKSGDSDKTKYYTTKHHQSHSKWLIKNRARKQYLKHVPDNKS